MNLKAEQSRLYELMPREARCFVRVCDEESALWVSDLPRRLSDYGNLPERLQAEGFRMRLDERTSMCYLDWTMEKWQKWVSCLPQVCPDLPEKAEYHETFALCQLWLMHPSELEEAHLPALRRVIKLMDQPQDKMLRAVRSLHEEAAIQLRSGKTVSSAAGRALAAWLYEQTDGKELLP